MEYCCRHNHQPDILEPMNICSKKYGVKTKGNAGGLPREQSQAVSVENQRRPVMLYHESIYQNGKSFTASFFAPDFCGPSRGTYYRVKPKLTGDTGHLLKDLGVTKNSLGYTKLIFCALISLKIYSRLTRHLNVDTTL